MNAKQTASLNKLTDQRPWIIKGKTVYSSIGMHPSEIRSLKTAGIISKLNDPIWNCYYYINGAK